MRNAQSVRQVLTSLLALALLFSTSLLIPGCQHDSNINTTAPHSIPELGDNNPSLWSVTIGSAGGTVTGANAVFVVPEDALSSSVAITMYYQASLADEVVMGPSGQTFAEGCTLTMDKPSGYDPSATYHIYLWNTSTSTWDDMGGVDNGGSVSATVWHFCKFMVQEYVN
ncbi:MAG: hypothetical protein KDA27_01220 [Candidatus Eisenbacteria bacterium]|uniref:SbsA Ig-like domain-containing protein n=1 Tax=Eiseniibacteriota bacterium TaxID=2212470 RepID=A0A956N8T6_UNCEI|nr:hypothetical protein [Candidatus Eisenbacteria bacterium]MCB9466253.1 hypothetical protein [Candidatus Eisenbacteria bacterium]